MGGPTAAHAADMVITMRHGHGMQPLRISYDSQQLTRATSSMRGLQYEEQQLKDTAYARQATLREFQEKEKARAAATLRKLRAERVAAEKQVTIRMHKCCTAHPH